MTQIHNNAISNELQLVLPVDFESAMHWEGWKHITSKIGHDTRRVGLFVRLPLDMPDDYEAVTDRWVGDKVRCVVLETRLFLCEKGKNRVHLSR